MVSWKRTAETKLKKVTIGCGHQRCGNNFITELFIKVGGYNVHTNQTTGTPNLIRIASHGKFKRIYITSSSSPSPCSTGNLLMKDQPYHPMPEEVAGFVKTFARTGEYCIDRHYEIRESYDDGACQRHER